MITLQLRIKQARGEPITIEHFVIDMIIILIIWYTDYADIIICISFDIGVCYSYVRKSYAKQKIKFLLIVTVTF